MHPLHQLKQAVLAALTGDATLMGMVTAVLDHATAANAYPHVILAAARAEDRSNLAKEAWRAQLTISVHTRERGGKACLAILDRIRALLHHASLSLAEDALALLQLASSEATPGRDGLSCIGTAVYVALIEDGA